MFLYFLKNTNMDTIKSANQLPLSKLKLYTLLENPNQLN